MSQEDNIKQYSAEDFERYYSGKMTEQQMHALEKAALDDPFLSDALDGYTYTQTAVSDINELKQKLLQNKDEKKIAWFKRSTVAPLLKIAAILVLFAGLGWLLFENNKINKTEIASLTDKSIIPATSENKKPDSLVPAQSGNSISTETATGAVQQQSIQLNTNPAPNLKIKKTVVNTTANTYTVNVTDAYAVTDSVSLNSTAYYSRKDTTVANGIDDALAGKVAGIQVRTQTNSPGTYLRGRITDSKGNPVSFASVVDNKNKQGISADQNGLFAFRSNDTAALVAINAVGYKPVTWKLNLDSTANNIVMNESNSLKEVIVTSAFQTKRATRSSSVVQSKAEQKKANIQRVMVTNAIPLDGWEDFYNYVNDSLKTLEQLGPESVSAEVLVSFNINDNGGPVDIQVQRSLCRTCEEEAIRILKNGPSWKLNNKRKKAHAVVKF